VSSVLPNPLPRTSLVEQLSQQLAAFIRDRNLLSGERLPSVLALAQHFSVGTPTMREALRRLEATGVVEIRHGSGIYVRDASSMLFLRNPLADEIDARTLLELLDARLLLEPVLAERAAERATSEDLARLGEAIADAERFLSGPEANDARLHEANMRFHRGIAAAAGSNVLNGIVSTITHMYDREQSAAMSLFDDRRRDFEEHRAIYEAIQNRKPRRSRELMTRHLSDVRSVVGSRLNGGDRQNPTPPKP
jgi:GntR family transcriptional repressor for pyruvate dehydrogenase complex